MKVFKHFFAGLASAIVLAQGAHAQIPVTDAASLAQQVQQVASWGQQITAMKDQLNQQKQLFESMNGGRGLGQLLNNPALKNALPGDWQKVYASLQKGGYAGLTGSAKAIRDANAIYDCTKLKGSALSLCNAEMNKAAQDKAFGQDAYGAAQLRLDNIQALMGQIDNATDAKTIADLQTRMQAEQAMIQNEQTKLMMFKMMAEADDKLLNQQKREYDLKNQTRQGNAAKNLAPRQF